jgi:hypothetical protein
MIKDGDYDPPFAAAIIGVGRHAGTDDPPEHPAHPFTAR